MHGGAFESVRISTHGLYDALIDMRANPAGYIEVEDTMRRLLELTLGTDFRPSWMVLVRMGVAYRCGYEIMRAHVESGCGVCAGCGAVADCGACHVRSSDRQPSATAMLAFMHSRVS